MKNIKTYIKIYGVAFSAFLIIDLAWIGLFANGFYRDRLGHLLSESPNLTAAVMFYLMFIAGLIYFAVRPALRDNKTLPGILKSGLYGLLTYGTYDLTNLALIKNWPLSVTLVDMVWGVGVSILIGSISIAFGRRLYTHDNIRGDI